MKLPANIKANWIARAKAAKISSVQPTVYLCINHPVPNFSILGLLCDICNVTYEIVEEHATIFRRYGSTRRNIGFPPEIIDTYNCGSWMGPKIDVYYLKQRIRSKLQQSTKTYEPNTDLLSLQLAGIDWNDLADIIEEFVAVDSTEKSNAMEIAQNYIHQGDWK